jgi:hypothetical protein
MSLEEGELHEKRIKNEDEGDGVNEIINKNEDK